MGAKQLAGVDDKRILMTLRQISEITGASYRTVASYAQKAGWTKNGKQTLLDDKQTAVIVEAMKIPKASGTKANLVSQLQGVEAADSRALRIKLLYQQIEKELEAEIDELRAENEIKSAHIAKLEEENVKQAKQLAVLGPKAEILDKITASNSDVSVKELAAILARPHLGPNNLFKRLRQDKYIDANNRPYWAFVKRGLVYEKEYYVPHINDVNRQLRITQKGVVYYFTGKYGKTAKE
jgi:phage antirepressor YoqD-like protein